MRSKSFKYKLLRVGISAAALSVLLLMLVNVLAVRSLSSHRTAAPEFSKAIAAQQFGMPVRWEGMDGQMDLSVRYLTRGPGSTLYFNPDEVVMVFKNHGEGKWLPPSVLKLQFIETSHSIVKGNDKSHNQVFSFRDHSLIQNNSKISGEAIFYGNLDAWGYISSGRHFGLPHLRLEGAKELLVDSDGNLRIRMGNSQELCMQKPFVYQFVKGEKVRIEAQFTLLAKNEIGFEIGQYDESQLLVIDPMFVYPT